MWPLGVMVCSIFKKNIFTSNVFSFVDIFAVDATDRADRTAEQPEIERACLCYYYFIYLFIYVLSYNVLSAS